MPSCVKAATGKLAPPPPGISPLSVRMWSRARHAQIGDRGSRWMCFNRPRRGTRNAAGDRALVDDKWTLLVQGCRCGKTMPPLVDGTARLQDAAARVPDEDGLSWPPPTSRSASRGSVNSRYLAHDEMTFFQARRVALRRRKGLRPSRPAEGEPHPRPRGPVRRPHGFRNPSSPTKPTRIKRAGDAGHLPRPFWQIRKPHHRRSISVNCCNIPRLEGAAKLIAAR